MVGRIAEGLTDGIEGLGRALAAPFSNAVLRLGVTGLSRAGKTVFITSLVANLLDRGRMPGFSPGPRIRAAWLQPQPDDTVPRFPFESHLARLTAAEPSWPEGTRGISELRLSFRLRGEGVMAALAGERVLHLDIVDYPGEWLLDLGLMGRSFAQWSSRALDRARARPEGAAFLNALAAADPAAPLQEPQAEALAAAWTGYLGALRAAGYADLTPGRFLLPGDLAGSPVLTFAPLPPADWPRGSLGRELARRFEAYKAQVVRPFFRDHFAKVDRQVVLVDVLGALGRGPRALDDLRAALSDILGSFRHGQPPWLARLLGARRVDRLLLAATKADHLHHSQHAALAALAAALLREAKDRAEFAGARTAAMAIASLRTTVEDEVTHLGRARAVVRGRLLASGRQVAFDPGALPADPARLLGPAREGAADWGALSLSAEEFAPAPLTLRPGEGPPHIRLDAAAEFLMGDRF